MITSSVVLRNRQIAADGRLTLSFEPAGGYDVEVEVSVTISPRSPQRAALFALNEGDVFDLELKAREP